MADKKLPPDTASQAELAWEHILRILSEAGMGVEAIVKFNQYLTRAQDTPGYVKARSRR